MTRPLRCLLAGVLLTLAACADARSPLDPENPAPQPGPTPLQGLACAVDLAQGGMTCGDLAPRTGDARGSGGVIVGGQNQLVRLASSGVAAVGDTIVVDVTIQNLISQSLGTTDGTTADGRGVRIFFSDGPTAHPQGTAWVANPDGEGFFLASAQPYFQYDTILGQNETSTPRKWKLAHTPGTTRITFTVYVAAQVQHEGESLVMTSPLNTFLLPGDTATLGAQVRDFAGRPIPGRAITWRTTEPDVVSVDPGTGKVTALKLGYAVVHAESGGMGTGSAVVVVSRETVVRVDVEPDSATVEMGGLVQLTATAYNVRGERIDETLQYSDGNIWVAVVNWNTGLVRGTHPGQTGISVGRDWGNAVAVITTRPGPEVQWRNVTTAQGHSCGVSTAGKGYCWGHNGAGQLGFGQVTGYGENVAVGVQGNLAFTTIDGGNWFTCGLAGGRAFCWGYPFFGQLGNGSVGYTDGTPTPQAVQGGHTFTALSAGFEHACALDENGAAWCWGNNTYGQLGNGDRRVVYGEPVPVAVTGGLTFRHISAGRDYTCAITPENDMYCWGNNERGQFGDGAGAPSLTIPYPVPGGAGYKWKTVATGDSHVCGVTVKGQAFCWGADFFGELGTGVAEASSDLPAPIASAETFVDIGVGTNHSCAVAEDGQAWCWGFDRWGQLGRGQKGSIDPYPVPEPVIGTARFTGSIQGGYRHTCALGVDGKPYCWGTDFHGEGGIQPDSEFCTVPGGSAPCHTRPRAVSNPAAGGVRTGPTTGTTTAPSVVQARAALTAPLTPRLRR